ncbi:unnamed protein product [Zymoseptoria tritici ST99CH_3D1]|nr:unnamed protein product [Zymoseptoria tritici ST99CH_3D1]
MKISILASTLLLALCASAAPAPDAVPDNNENNLACANRPFCQQHGHFDNLRCHCCFFPSDKKNCPH